METTAKDIQEIKCIHSNRNWMKSVKRDGNFLFYIRKEVKFGLRIRNHLKITINYYVPRNLYDLVKQFSKLFKHYFLYMYIHIRIEETIYTVSLQTSTIMYTVTLISYVLYKKQYYVGNKRSFLPVCCN